jgi:hypothetical protein
MTRRVIIHLGPEKTGSTALQRHLLGHRDELLERHGVLYPLSGRDPEHASEAHMRLFFTAQRGGALEEVVNDLLREADEGRAEVIVLSHERLGHLYRHRPESIGRLQELLRGCEVDLVLYPRRQDNWIMSDYNQRLKPAVFLARIGLDKEIEESGLEGAYWRVDYAAMLQAWEEAFRARIIVRPFERSQLRDGDVIADFGDVIGVDLRPFRPVGSERFNTSLHDLAVSFAVQANALMRRWYPPRLWEAWGDVLRAYNEHLRYDFADALADEDERRFGPLLSPSRRREVMSRFVEGNELVARRYLPKRGDRLFDEDPPPSDAPWAPPARVEGRHVDRLGPLVGLGETVPGEDVPAKMRRVLTAFVDARGGRPSGGARLRARLSDRLARIRG